MGPEPQESQQGNYSGMVTENPGLEGEEMVTVKVPLLLAHSAEEFPRKFLALLCPTVWLG